MKNKTITTIFLTSILTVMWCSAAWAADRFNTRDNRQTRRIHQGIHSGKITRPEVHYLKKDSVGSTAFMIARSQMDILTGTNVGV